MWHAVVRRLSPVVEVKLKVKADTETRDRRSSIYYLPIHYTTQKCNDYVPFLLALRHSLFVDRYVVAMPFFSTTTTSMIILQIHAGCSVEHPPALQLLLLLLLLLLHITYTHHHLHWASTKMAYPTPNFQHTSPS